MLTQSKFAHCESVNSKGDESEILVRLPVVVLWVKTKLRLVIKHTSLLMSSKITQMFSQ